MGVEENPRHSQQGWRVRNVKVKANSKGKVQHIAKILLEEYRNLYIEAERLVFFEEVSVRSSPPVKSMYIFLLK